MRDEVWRQVARLQNPHAGAVQAIQEKVRNNFKFQKFFCKGILEKHAKVFREQLAQSGLPFAKNEITRIEDREDKFARRIFTTSLCDTRCRVNLEEFRLSRAYFFGLLQRDGKDEDGNIQMYPCLITNKKGAICGQLCDPFGHGAFLCKATTRASDYNHARDIIESMGQAFDFITSKEVVIFPLAEKKKQM